MIAPTPAESSAAAASLDPTRALALYEMMARISAADTVIQRGLSAGELSFQYYPCAGQEAIAAGAAAALRPDDFMVTTYRGIHDIMAKGTPLREVLAEVMGKQNGCSKGKGGPMHLSDPSSGLMVTTGIVGSGIPIASGLGLAAQLRQTGQVVLANFGDGATSIGAFHEGLLIASLWKLPVIFLCQNNQYAEYTAIDEYTPMRDLSARAMGYGMRGARVDGTDPLAVLSTTAEAVERARRGEGPTLIEAYCERLQGHSFGSDETHMDQERLRLARSNPPLTRYRASLIERGVATAARLVALEEAARMEVEAARAEARLGEPPAAQELYTDIFADQQVIPLEPSRVFVPGGARAEPVSVPLPGPVRTMTYCDAVNEALSLALQMDPSVVLLGEDIADPAGGVAKATRGLSTRFGRERVRSTPIAEEGIAGAAIGAALGGLRPIAEIMINDFMMVAMDQIANHAAKLRYMSGGRTHVPLTIRTLTAAAVGSFGAQHSQSLEAWLTHTPGLKVVFPSSPAEAKGLLLSAIADDDPVVVFEALKDYFSSGPVPEGDYRIPLGTAAIKQSGNDLTVLTYGWSVAESLAAAKTLGQEGIAIEVIDLRSLVPLDLDTILESVRRTRRCVIVHAAVGFCGFGAELAFQIYGRLSTVLKGPIVRICGEYTPVPFASGLEALHFPLHDRIVTGIRDSLLDSKCQ